MDIIRRCEEKINSLIEKFTNKPDNISMKQVVWHTTISPGEKIASPIIRLGASHADTIQKAEPAEVFNNRSCDFLTLLLN